MHEEMKPTPLERGNVEVAREGVAIAVEDVIRDLGGIRSQEHENAVLAREVAMRIEADIGSLACAIEAAVGEAFWNLADVMHEEMEPCCDAAEEDGRRLALEMERKGLVVEIRPDVWQLTPAGEAEAARRRAEKSAAPRLFEP